MVFAIVSVVVGLCFVFLGCLLFKVTPRYLSHFFFLYGGIVNRNKTY